MYQNCMPDIMTLSQAVLQIFCSQDVFSIQERDIIQSNIYRTLPNVNQVIYTFDISVCQYHDTSSNGSPDIFFIRFQRVNNA